ncbi:hypothetical protein KQI84_11490 [bacterium]|nr:hypothetical protein [bacterium]
MIEETPFVRLIAGDYYDGEISGLVEDRDSQWHVLALLDRRLDTGAQRVFGIAPVGQEIAGELVELLKSRTPEATEQMQQGIWRLDLIEAGKSIYDLIQRALSNAGPISEIALCDSRGLLDGLISLRSISTESENLDLREHAWMNGERATRDWFELFR